jgi:hypothetical protein
VSVRGESTGLAGVQRWVESGNGPIVLLLHGIYAAAGAHEFDRLVPLLASTRTVRVPDLLGFGDSDRPAEQFTSDLLGRAVDSLLDDIPDDGTVVASSLTGAYTVTALDERGWRGRLVLITPTGLGGSQTSTPGLPGRAVEGLLRRTPVGDLLARGLVSRPSISWFLRRQAYADPAEVTPDTIDAHLAAADHPHLKYPLVAFVSGCLARPVDPSAVRRLRPTVIWARGQSFTPQADADSWSDAGATVLRLPSGLPHVEQPEAVAEVVLRAE